jgi:GNAT superfamily N-acetyltransferase
MKMLEVLPTAAFDETRVFKLLKQLPLENAGAPFNWDSGKAAFPVIVADAEKGTILLAHEGDLLLGICSLSFPMAVHCAGKYACIEEFIVSPNSRGKGVGGRRIEAAVARATEGGCYEIQPNRPSELGHRRLSATGVSRCRETPVDEPAATPRTTAYLLTRPT